LVPAFKASFREFFKKCDVIIDCMEIFIERPSDLLTRAQVWSNYKHHSTTKFLIGITPQGTISYVSDWISDKKLLSSQILLISFSQVRKLHIENNNMYTAIQEMRY